MKKIYLTDKQWIVLARLYSNIRSSKYMKEEIKLLDKIHRLGYILTNEVQSINDTYRIVELSLNFKKHHEKN